MNDLTIYDRYAADWWSGRYRFLRTLQNLVPARFNYFDSVVTDWQSLSVLDLGCGGGYMAEALCERGAKVIGLDPAQSAIGVARSRAAEMNMDIDYRVGMGEAIPVESASLDVVVCVDVLEHIPKWPEVLAEIHRVLKPGGVFLFDTINRSFFARFVAIILGEYLLRILPVGTHDGKLFIKPKEIHKELSRLGFHVQPFKGLGPKGINRRFDITFGLLPFQSVMYIGAAKRSA